VIGDMNELKGGDLKDKALSTLVTTNLNADVSPSPSLNPMPRTSSNQTRSTLTRDSAALGMFEARRFWTVDAVCGTDFS
jgi:hypothetical protein